MLSRLVPAVLLVALVTDLAHAQPPSFLNFESGHVRPLALSPDGDRLFVINTPDSRLEIFDVTGDAPVLSASVGVGLEPVAVAIESADRAWVVNHLSDSVSIVDVGADPPRVVRTLAVGDEPRDIVFAGPGRRRAFITTAHRGTASPTPRGEYDTPGVGRADVWVFDADDLGDFDGTALTVLTLFGDVPRALATNADGTRVYASVFLSGNRTTTISEGAVCDMDAPCTIEGTTYPGGLPPPVENHQGMAAPEVGLIVRQHETDGPWVDELGRDWSPAVRFSLPDEDVFAIDAMASTPAMTESFAGVGTVLYGMAVHPTTGDVYVANTEAFNEVRFEGLGEYVRSLGIREDGEPASVRGHLHEARITRIGTGGVSPVHLNPHIDYDARVIPDDVRWRTLAIPTALAFSADGSTLYVVATGSSAIGVLSTSDLESGTVDTDLARSIPLRDPWPGGPSGLVVDDARGRLYVTTRFDNALVTVDLEARAVSARLRMHSPEDEATIVGRPLLYDALATSSNGESSCASCHVFGDLDGLAWDLGDPDGDVVPNQNPRGPIATMAPFHPMKGPMTTQSFRGMADHGPMHWRGDRTAGAGDAALDEVGAFETFNVAFFGLLGREEGPLTTEEMRRYAEFAVGIMYPPNPIRRLDNSLRPDEQRGSDLYGHTDPGAPFFDTVATCDGCHSYDRSQGFFGSGGQTTFENEPQEMKVAHLRNLYQKVGMFGMPSVDFFRDGTDFSFAGDQVRGFGFLHDGSVDTVERFLTATVFSISDAQRQDMTAFMMAFDSVLPPIVGQQITVSGALSAEERDRIDLLIDRATTPMVWPGGSTTTECDLVVRGVFGGEDRGFLLEGDAFLSDRVRDPPIPIASLETAIGAADVLTFTCVPPGSGARMAYDRDEDGTRDGDEIDDGTDPTDRPLVDIPVVDVPPRPVPPMPDAGTDAGTMMDAGPADATTDAGSTPTDDGCGCRTTGTGDIALPLLLLFLLPRRKWTD